jgi:hypothetical protein
LEEDNMLFYLPIINNQIRPIGYELMIEKRLFPVLVIQ